MVSKRVEEALNKQISLEGNSSQFYLSMASWAESQGYNGTAEFLYRQTDEERQHMLKLIRYVNERGGTALIPQIDAPPVNFEGLEKVFEMLLQHELKVTAAVNDVVHICLEEKDYTTHNFMQWYVIQAYSGYENKVREALLERIERFQMEDKFSEVMVPAEEVVELKGGQERRVQRKFFPGYILLNMELDDDSWHLVKDTPRVMGFIGGSKEKPSPISEEEAKAIMQQQQLGAEVTKPKITFEPGEMVRVIDGPFNDFSGAVEEVNFEKSKVRVAVLIFGRSTPVELEFSQIEKA